MSANVLDFRLDTGVELPGEAALQVGATLWWPAEPRSAAAVLVCLAGGGMNRRYYDLQPEDGDPSFSFARQMVARGFVVLALDYLGTGDSDRPADGYALTAELLTRANLHAATQALAGLREGRLVPGLPALPGLPSLGIGHSMGGMMTVLLQAQARLHAGVALLGFGTRGLPDFVPAEARELARDTAAVRAQLVELARKQFVQPYPVIKPSPQSNGLYGGAAADPRGVQAIKAAMGNLLPVPAFLSMLPGNVAPEALLIDVPVFLGLGERDMAGPPHQIPAAFPGSRDVTLYLLPEAGHSHFLFPARIGLFDRLAAWARSIL